MGRDQPSTPLPSIPSLRAALTAVESSGPDVIKALHGQRLAESLLRRFCYLGHRDDLHEAIWVFFDALALTPATSYRRLEIYS
ncbi:hypothetical protein HYPSUDRAFT_48442 [Hypholoma sublateritium FD-334 SS-4]|uniref:Uncharacterized protein n=1 Tax=Hypholoma sublateritium (strain FD-334 SS-4) TaxID=945553 RepID=A0A0D2LX22_HYPSF|nr:hypothetical protein HYPSUDRAFT_48442 [Hypholoma sublateritium FD-334 SS-4]